MKTILLPLASFIFITSFAQKFSLTSRANMNTAVGEQVGKFKNAYGLGFGFEIPIKKIPSLKLVMNADAGINGMRSMPYEFEFQNTLTKTEINYSSDVLEITTGLRYIFNESKKLQPYTGIGVGMLRYSTNYEIEDPKNPDGCDAIESEKILADESLIGKIEAGLRYTSNWQIYLRNVSFDVGVRYINGTTAKYMRLSNIHTETGADYSVKFKSSSNEVHEHAIGKMYNTPVNQLGFHIGMVIPFGCYAK
ncbi:MAG: hypothetical protein ICV66_03215 [Chitinophagaceae bacterium]|nr:hypothetical protein [Chitinophagaceae bacterium]